MMNYKEKYEIALERARALHDEAIAKGYALDYVKDYEAIFPELAESEDERLLNTIIRGFEAWKGNGNVTFNNTDVDDILAYLEKQKPTAWSKKQDDIIGYIRHILNDHAFEHDGLDVNGDYCTDEYVQADDFLKSLRPQKLDASKLENFDPVDVLNRIKKEWPMAWEKVVGKQEWSKEDEKCLQEMIRHIGHCVKVYGAEQPEWQQWLNLLKKLMEE